MRTLASLRAPCAVPGLLQALDDEDLRICAVAVDALNAFGGGIPPSYDRIEALLHRLPDRRTPIGGGLWTPGGTLERHDVAKLLAQHRSLPELDRVLPWVDALEPWHRKTVVAQLSLWGTTPAHRAALIARLSDTSSDVREVAIRLVAEKPMSAEEAESLEPLLRRKPGDLRRGVIALLLAQGPAWALESAERLAAGRDAQQRLGGVEILRRIAATDAAEAGAARRRLAELEDTDATVVDAASRATTENATVRATEADGFGLFDPAALTPGRPPAKTGRRPDSPAARAVLAALRELVAAHAATEVEVDHPWDGTTAMTPFGELTSWRLASYRHRSPGPTSAAGAATTTPSGDGEAAGTVPSPGPGRALGSGFPLAAVWDAFVRDLPPASRDQDAQHLLRAYVLADRETRAAPTRTAAERLAVAEQVLHALVVAHADAGTVAAALDAAEHELAGVPRKDLGGGIHGRNHLELPALDLLRELLAGPLPEVPADVATRHWTLERWLAEPPGVPFPKVQNLGRDTPKVPVGGRFPWRPPAAVVVPAHARGAASDADLLDHLAGPRGDATFHDLGALSTPGSPLAPAAGTRELALRVRDRVVALELGRGEAPTAATDAARTLVHSGGGTVLVAALRALGKDRFVRGWSSDGRGRAAAFSHMVSTTHPGDGDDPDAVAAALLAAKIRPARLRELACYAPQWADHVERALGEPGFADTVWWLHAHTKDDRWYAPDGLARQWRGEVVRRTSLTDAQLVDGAVDVAWFERVREMLGDDGLTAALKAAKYGSTAGGHKRAELFARAMSGTVGEDELLQRITDKRHQDTVRALGLLPLPADPDERRDAVLRRYEALQEFRRGSRAFGNQRRTTEGRATDVGFENLARTAGFRDPVRLTWAMEAQSTADLRGDGVAVALDDLTVTLRVDDDGRPVVAVRRGEKALKAVPAAARKVPEVKALTGRATGLRKQATRVRTALEDAMVRGDALDGDELLGYREHALLWPQLRSVVLVGEGTTGTPGPDGRTLIAHDGTVHAIGHREPLRIAHPRDLLDRGVWPEWQRHVLATRTIQPFKQVFRELYVPTATEEESPGVSRRYAGHQLQPARTRALLSARGWSVSHEDGVERTDHGLGITAELWFLDGFGSPVEVEPPVLEQVRFRTAREGTTVALADVPERLFSEVMRDVDLIVSVAHASGVDPEASSSTVEVRAALLRETLDVVGVENVTIDGPRAVIDGAIARYSVHLGGGTVHTLPGGAVCIVPVHAQQRGRVFLPFADDDPKTAEIISKTLMLARDDKIKDPTILEQLRR